MGQKMFTISNRSRSIRVSDDYYMVDGYYRQIPVKVALPSQDGDYWIFYRDNVSGGQSTVYCFFVPMNF